MSKMDQFTHKLTYHNGSLGFYLVYECIGPFYTFIKFRKKNLIVIIITIQKCIRCLHCFYFFYIVIMSSQLYGSLKRQSFIIAIRKYHTERSV